MLVPLLCLSLNDVSLTSVKKKVKHRAVSQGLSIDEKKGLLTSYNERFLLIPVKLIHAIEDRLTGDFGAATATSFQYEIGKEGGAEYVQIARRAGLDIKRQADIRELAGRMGTLSGWGRVEIVEFNFEKKLARVRWTNGVSVRNRNGRTAVCDFGRGVLTGAVEEIFDRKSESLETSCQGKGDEYCEAVIGDAAEIERVAGRLR
jgi:predicted hydrocarbon binding protein